MYVMYIACRLWRTTTGSSWNAVLTHSPLAVSTRCRHYVIKCLQVSSTVVIASSLYGVVKVASHGFTCLQVVHQGWHKASYALWINLNTCLPRMQPVRRRMIYISIHIRIYNKFF